MKNNDVTPNSSVYAYSLATITMVVALCISATAAWYSIAGLVAIFAAARTPIIIMGGVLEVGKIVATVWLHTNWHWASRIMRIYLSIAVGLLMFITSMGVFGFLSKSHIEQTAQSLDQQAIIRTLDSNINRSELKLSRWQTDLDSLNSGSSTRVDSLIETEQETLNGLRQTIKQEKDVLTTRADKDIERQQERHRQAIERKKSDIDTSERKYNSSNKTEDDTTRYNTEIDNARRNEIGVASLVQREISKISDNLNKNLANIDKRYHPSIQSSQNRIQELRDNASIKTTEDINLKVQKLEQQVSAEQSKVNEWQAEKNGIEKEYRKLEAEVGPIKYIAEFIYGEEADKNLLEAAVRWVIIIIVIVFDPLAIMLVLASTMQFKYLRREKMIAQEQMLNTDDDILAQIQKKRMTPTKKKAKKKTFMTYLLGKNIKNSIKTRKKPVKKQKRS